MSNQGCGVSFDLSSVKLMEVVSLLLKDRAYDLDKCVAELLSKISMDLAGNDLSGVKVVDDIYQELIYFSYCLSEISSAAVNEKSCDAVFLLDNCKVARIQKKMIVLMESRARNQ